MKREYKCTEKRLAEYFESSRDKWKERSNKNQKEKKELLTIVRDLQRSKEKWKTECLNLRCELNELQNIKKKKKL